MIPLAAFEGRWEVRRQIDDAHTNQHGRFEGQAVFSPRDGGMHYAETGRLHLGDAPPMQAERHYLWHSDAERIVVQFPDGRDFHSFTTTPAAQATHLCGEDLYEVRYDFAQWPIWTAIWKVSGPRKAYEMTSTYQQR